MGVRFLVLFALRIRGRPPSDASRRERTPSQEDNHLPVGNRHGSRKSLKKRFETSVRECHLTETSSLVSRSRQQTRNPPQTRVGPESTSVQKERWRTVGKQATSTSRRRDYSTALTE